MLYFGALRGNECGAGHLSGFLFIAFALIISKGTKGAGNNVEGTSVVVVVVLLFYVHGKHLRSCRDGQLT